ncbi:hypothetical protein JOL62DRAFT_177660 [Phyllosticta paracitricarpa]|uniref:Uncharacterized protein n=1 Tax=Phyllosticta paracitricarpa TaxID=2016321 RepID=A0ABR1N2T0_9PEZI
MQTPPRPASLVFCPAHTYLCPRNFFRHSCVPPKPLVQTSFHSPHHHHHDPPSVLPSLPPPTPHNDRCVLRLRHPPLHVIAPRPRKPLQLTLPLCPSFVPNLCAFSSLSFPTFQFFFFFFFLGGGFLLHRSADIVIYPRHHALNIVSRTYARDFPRPQNFSLFPLLLRRPSSCGATEKGRSGVMRFELMVIAHVATR